MCMHLKPWWAVYFMYRHTFKPDSIIFDMRFGVSSRGLVDSMRLAYNAMLTRICM